MTQTAAVDVDRIDGKARTIRELFTSCKYGVDYLQREYAWTQAVTARAKWLTSRHAICHTLCSGPTVSSRISETLG